MSWLEKKIRDKVFKVGKIWSTPTNVRTWDRTSPPTGHLWTQNGSDLRPNLTLSVRKGIGHQAILGPISVRIWIGHISAYNRVLAQPVTPCELPRPSAFNGVRHEHSVPSALNLPVEDWWRATLPLRHLATITAFIYYLYDTS